MRQFELDSIFEIEANRRLATDALAFYEGLRDEPSSLIRFDGPPMTLDERIELARLALQLVDQREQEFYDEGWGQLTFWLNREGMDWWPAP